MAFNEPTGGWVPLLFSVSLGMSALDHINVSEGDNMSLLNEFVTSTPRNLSCGCPVERGICSCGLTMQHGGIEVGDNTHKTICTVHPTK